MKLNREYVCIQQYNGDLKVGDIITVSDIDGLCIHHEVYREMFYGESDRDFWWFGRLYNGKLDEKNTLRFNKYFKVLNPIEFKFIHE